MLDKSNITTDGAVVYAYCLMYDRRTDPDGRSHFRRLLDDGHLTQRQMVMELYRSTEFQNRFQPNSLNNSEFVYYAYNLLLLRDPDPDGYSHYLDFLNRGWITREGMINDMAASPEFRMVNPPLAD